jgi:hypothetical protein
MSQADDLPFTSPDVKPPPSREPRPGEFVWALEKDVKQVVCELHDHGADSFEAQLVRNGEFSASRRFATRARALAHADAIRMLLEGAGWRLVVVIGTATL